MKHVSFTGTIHQPDRFEAETLEIVQVMQAGDLGVEASRADLPVAFVDSAKRDDVVARCGLAARYAPDLLDLGHSSPRRAFVCEAARATKAMQFTRFQIASMRYLSESSGAMRASHFEVSPIT